MQSRAAKLSFHSGGLIPSEACGSKARQRDGQNDDHGDHRAGDQPTHENLPFIATEWRFSCLQQSRGRESRPAKGSLSSPEDNEKLDGAQKSCSAGLFSSVARRRRALIARRESFEG